MTDRDMHDEAILVVDDDEAVLRLIAKILAADGHPISSASNDLLEAYARATIAQAREILLAR